MDFHHLLLSFSYGAIFFLMISNGIINIPSSQILYVIVGFFASTGNLDLSLSIISGSIGNTIGNTIAFLIAKKYGHAVARKILMLNEKTFLKIHGALHETFARRGMWWIFLGKLTPSIKAFVPVVAGLADTNTTFTAVLFFIASCIWASILTSLGYEFGEHVSLSLFMAVSLLVGIIILAIVYYQVRKKLKS